MLGFLKKPKHLKEELLEAQIERSESAFQIAMDAEERGDNSTAKHFLEVAIREEAKAFR